MSKGFDVNIGKGFEIDTGKGFEIDTGKDFDVDAKMEADLAKLEAELAKLEADLSKLEAELGKLEVEGGKVEAKTEAEVKAEGGEVKPQPEVKTDINRLGSKAQEINAKKKETTIETEAPKAENYKKSNIGTYVKVGVALVAIGTLVGLALKRYLNNNNKTGNIKKIYNKDDSIVVEYDTPIKFCKNDRVVINGTNSVPLIDGDYTEFKVADNGMAIFLKGKVSTDGYSGTITCKTSFESSMACVLVDVSRTAAGLAGDVSKNVFDELLKSLGLNDFFKNNKTIIFIVCGVLAAISLLILLVKIKNLVGSERRSSYFPSSPPTPYLSTPHYSSNVPGPRF